MAKNKFIEVSYGDVRFQIDDVAMLEFARKHESTLAHDLTSAIICGVHAVEVAGASKETVALESHLARVYRDMQDMSSVVVSNLKNVLVEAADPSKNNSLSNVVADGLKRESQGIIASMDIENPDSSMGRLAAELRGAVMQIVRSSGGAEAKKALMPKLAAKGGIYEELVVSALTQCAGAFSDTVEATGSEIGIGTSKKGDAVIRLGGEGDRAIVVEAKHKKITLSTKFIEDELRAGISNRGARAAILVVHPEFASSVGAPVKFLADNIVACIFDPDGADMTALQVAYYVTRAWAMREHDSGGVCNSSHITRRLGEISAKVEGLNVVERSMSQSIDDLERCRAAFGDIRRSVMREIRDLARDAAGEPYSQVEASAASRNLGEVDATVCIEGGRLNLLDMEPVASLPIAKVNEKVKEPNSKNQIPIF